MAATASLKKARFWNRVFIAVLGLIALVSAVGATAYMVSDGKPQKVIYRTAGQPAPQRVADCDDGNIVGAAIGGVTGGVLGNQVGKGSGNTAATIGGALGGAYLGKEHLPTRNVTCR